MKKLIKQNLRFYSKFLLLIGALIAFICSFGVSSYAWSLGSDGNLHSDNLIDNSSTVFELGAVSYNVGATYSSNKVSGNYRIRTINLIDVDSTKTYSLSVPSPYWVIAQGYNNGLQVSQDGTQFNQALPSLSFTGVSQVAIIVRRIDNGNFSSASDISNIDLMFNVGNVKDYEPYDAVYYSQDNYDSAGYNILGGLESFDAINLYYSSSMTFVSTDGGITYVNANNQDVSNTLITNSDGSRSLLIDKTNPWGYTNYYYVHVDFSYPVFLWRLRILNSLKPTDFIKVVVNDREITYFDYKPNIDGSSYIVSGDIYQQTNSVDFYFRINGYTATSNRSFVLGYDGYNVGVDSYREGYEKGQEDLQPKIEALEDKVIMLSNDNENLRVQLGNNFGWQTLFFAMADTPFYTVSNMLNFEVLGINLFQALIGFITIIAIVWILKRLVK